MSKKSAFLGSVSTNKPKVAEKFANERKFIEHNKELKAEAEVKTNIQLIQEFLDVYYEDTNNGYLLALTEPKSIAKIVTHFRKMNWNVSLHSNQDKIRLIFSAKE